MAAAYAGRTRPVEAGREPLGKEFVCGPRWLSTRCSRRRTCCRSWQPTVSKVENGRMVPSLDVLGRLSLALDLDESTSHAVLLARRVDRIGQNKGRQQAK
ncbi:helix-turn-helix transcriptional regulator [Streptomyces sp. B21-105]|uniref:helix-turn-helix transcriptional regulator n=1 Tax=Streptomyces sp. B21-105 TaxID=3039417 RepID=UPI002FF07905